jgi:hypothetical protein
VPYRQAQQRLLTVVARAELDDHAINPNTASLSTTFFFWLPDEALENLDNNNMEATVG